MRISETVSNELRVDKYTVNDIIVYYVKDMFYVNRRYQRKLVWDLKDKQLLIDSLLRGIPLPAILIARYQLGDEKDTVLEVVDGMQRLNAIITFLLGDFSIKYEGKDCYFDPNANNETFNLVRENVIDYDESRQYLPKDICLELCRTEIPTIITGQDDTTIEMIFSRINSAGRKISSHDLRQSSATGEFPDLVRRIASRIRKDYTYEDRVCLKDMPKISIGLSKYGYGVDLETIFWRRHDLVNVSNIKESRDEEIIETLVAMELLDFKFRKSTKSLNQLYDINSKLGKQIEQRVLQLGKDELENNFSRVFDEVDMIFNAVNSDFTSFLFKLKKTKNKDECFKILFLALYELFVDGYSIVNYKEVADILKESGSLFTEYTDVEKVNYEAIQVSVKNLKKILVSAMTKKVVLQEKEMTTEIDKRLT